MTTPMPQDDGFPRELLAAYVDGELDAVDRAAVERWLSDHPDGQDETNAQRALSPANAMFWDRAEPPEPSRAVWVAVRNEIEHQLSPRASAFSRWRTATWALAGLATAGVAAAVAWVAFGPAAKLPPIDHPSVKEQARVSEMAPYPREFIAIAPAPRSPDPLSGFAVLPMATDDDVILFRVPEFTPGWLPVGLHPLPGTMTLALEDDVSLAEVAPNPAWPTGLPKMFTAPGDAAIIYTAKIR